jgi:NarL family two-component system response regulator LiaR
MRVLLADDHTLVRAGVRALLDGITEVTVVAETGDGREALALIETHRPDVALLDITMPGLNGLEVATRAAVASPRTRILVLSMHAAPAYVAQALRVGVAGYLLKDAAAVELEVAIRAVARGESYLSPAISKQVVDGFLRGSDPSPDPLAALTSRQREILQLVAEGRSTKQIASALDVSVKTVETHRAQLMERLNIHDVPGLVRFAIRAGIVSSEG